PYSLHYTLYSSHPNATPEIYSLSLTTLFRSLDEAAEVLVDVHTARVVIIDELFDPLHKFVSGRVPRRRCDGLLAQQLRQSVGLGSFPSGELRRQTFVVDLLTVNERIWYDHLCRG